MYWRGGAFKRMKKNKKDTPVLDYQEKNQSNNERNNFESIGEKVNNEIISLENLFKAEDDLFEKIAQRIISNSQIHE